MPMGIVSDSDFDKELRNSNKTGKSESNQSVTIQPPSISADIVDVTRGRPNGAVEVPNGLRKLIGEESAVNGRQSALELAQSFGISPSSVSAYNAGATSTASYSDTPNRQHIDNAKQRVANVARKRLMGALRHITPEKLEGARVKDLAGIARDLSAVVKNMEPETPKIIGESGPKAPTFIFYSPQFRKEEHYDVVKSSD
jgi:hypothetical protein